MRLSKIAHKSKVKVQIREGIKPGASARRMRIRFQADVLRGIESHESLRVGQIEFPSTVEANLIRAVFYREHTAEVTVPAAKEKLKDSKE